jgi:hypothetical protein
MSKLDERTLERLKPDQRTYREQLPNNGAQTPSKDRVREAVREAHDPRRLVTDPPTHRMG